MGRKQRLPFVELFDVSNVEDDGSLVKIGSKRDAMGRVSNFSNPILVQQDLFR